LLAHISASVRCLVASLDHFFAQIEHVFASPGQLSASDGHFIASVGHCFASLAQSFAYDGHIFVSVRQCFASGGHVLAPVFLSSGRSIDSYKQSNRSLNRRWLVSGQRFRLTYEREDAFNPG